MAGKLVLVHRTVSVAANSIVKILSVHPVGQTNLRIYAREEENIRLTQKIDG